MGYCMEQHGGEFFIAAEDQAKALAAAKQLFDDVNSKGRGGSYSGGQKTASWFSWVDTKTALNTSTLADMFDEWGWSVEEDEDGNINGLWFDRDKIGQEELLFQTIAPWVKSGSYVEMHGEDGTMWRWCWENGKCSEKYANVSWE